MYYPAEHVGFTSEHKRGCPSGKTSGLNWGLLHVRRVPERPESPPRIFGLITAKTVK